ncbi:hypothetical protein JCM6882_001210 [Rhodosporidiobolus microsporus]
MLRTAARTVTASLTRRAPASSAVLRFALPSSVLSKPSRFPTLTMARSASTTTGPSSSFDPQDAAAQDALDQGTEALGRGDLNAAEEAYKRSAGIKETSIGYYNLGVVQYQLQNLSGAITSFEKSLALSAAQGIKATLPDPTKDVPPLTPAQVILADTHTNLGAAYILSQPPKPEKALEHLQKALMVNPDDGEVCYNLAAVLEATSEFDEALVAFERAHKLGIQRAEVNIRNVSAKILGKKREEEAKAKATGGSVSATTAAPSEKK